MNYTLKGAQLEVTAAERGAELISVRFMGKERLWQNADGSWAGHAPVLFPVCGSCAVKIDGKEYPCPKHGFAMDSDFTLFEKTDNSLKFRLIQDEKSKIYYPYDFVFCVEYKIREKELSIVYEVYNPQDGALYFSCGGHDSFILESALENYVLEFEREEKFQSLLVGGGGMLTGESAPLGNGRILSLSTGLLENGNSVCFDKLNSRCVVLLEEKTGKSVVRLNFPQTDKLVLWRPHGADMLCIEPWQNLPDVVGSDKEFGDKDGVIRVEPRKSVRVARTVTYY